MSNYEQHDDTFREESENPQLVQDLHNLYDTHSADAQSLARIRSRLLQRASIPLPDKEDDNIIMLQPLDAPERRASETAPRTTRRLNGWRNARRHWPRLVSEIAALILITALVGSVVLIFSLRQHGSGHNGPPSSNPYGQIVRIHMIDANIGWAIVQTKHGNNLDSAPALMRTTDGGKTWYDVTPPEPSNVAQESAFQMHFWSSNTAWIELISSANGITPLSFTNDGGQTWQETSVPATSIRQMTFIDPQHGWILANAPDGDDFGNGTLFQTIDGGKTWTQLSHSSPTSLLSDTTVGPLPSTSVNMGFTFINTQTGWIVGQTQALDFFWFYVTHDGGRTWQHQNLPQPILPNSPTGRKPQFLLQPPTFFGHEGLISFIIPTNGNYPVDQSVASGGILEIYVTHDSGVTWQPSASDSADTALDANEAPQFEDATHGRFTIDNQLFLMHRVSDGWIFTRYKANGTIFQSNFISPSIGWIIVDTAPNSYGVSSNDQLLLYQTTDGGQTWTQINYSVMGQKVQTAQKLHAGWVAVANYSSMGSKVMFLRGPQKASKEWGLVYTLSCTDIGSFKATLFDTQALSNMATSGSIGGASFSEACPTNIPLSYLISASSEAFTATGVQIQSISSAKWSILVVKCTNLQECSYSPIAK